MAKITDLQELHELQDDDIIYVVRPEPTGDYQLRRETLRQDVTEPANRAEAAASEAAGYRDQAEGYRDEVDGKVGFLQGTISVLDEGDDFVELKALNPAELVETTEPLGDIEIGIVEITLS